jgi:hypothetical protein
VHTARRTARRRRKKGSRPVPCTSRPLAAARAPALRASGPPPPKGCPVLRGRQASVSLGGASHCCATPPNVTAFGGGRTAKAVGGSRGFKLLQIRQRWSALTGANSALGGGSRPLARCRGRFAAVSGYGASPSARSDKETPGRRSSARPLAMATVDIWNRRGNPHFSVHT